MTRTTVLLIEAGGADRHPMCHVPKGSGTLMENEKYAWRYRAQSPIADRIDHEMFPGVDVQSDDDLIDSALDGGYTGYHAVGSCAMGPSDGDAVDDRLRVRGVHGLRVVDCSAMPIMLAGNLNGPVMAMAGRPPR